MLPQEIIRQKRLGCALSTADIDAFVHGVTDGSVTEGQVAALCMAILWRGLSLEERIDLTRAMTHSGTVLDWSNPGLDGPVLDKHSSGGVGDKVSLILAPAVAACGGYVPMISGRGLGHTGGTLDKLDSIPGYATAPDRARLAAVVRQVGCAIVGATDDIAPADRRMYAIRDATGTVESIDLITASILSKKLAAGVKGLVLDVKFGSGAFVASLEEAETLAESLVTVGTGAEVPTVALLTDMNQVLGRTAGNAVEVAEAIELLAGEARDPRLWEITLALGAEMLVLGRLCDTLETGRQQIARAVDSGEAAERFARMVADLGGPRDLLSSWRRHLPTAPIVRAVEADRRGVVTAMDTRVLGVAVVELGGGRRAPAEPIDHTVGLGDVVAVGEQVGPGERPLAVIHARSDGAAEAAARTVRQAIRIGDHGVKPRPLIARRIVR